MFLVNRTNIITHITSIMKGKSGASRLNPGVSCQRRMPTI